MPDKFRWGIRWSPLTIALEKVLREIPEGSYISLAQIAKQAGYKNPSDSAGQLMDNSLFKRILGEKKFRIVENAGINFNAETYLPPEEFKQILKNNPQRDFELVKTLKGRTTVGGDPWNRSHIQVMRGKLKIPSQLYENISPKAILADAKILAPDLLKQYQNKKLSYNDLEQRVRRRRRERKITVEQTEKWKETRRLKHSKRTFEQKEADRLKNKAIKDLVAIQKGAVPTASYGTKFFKKDAVWFNLYETALLNEGKTIPKGSKTTIFKSAIPAKHATEAVRGATLIDTLTGKTLTYDNFVEFIDKNKPGGKDFNGMVAEFEKKQFIAQRPELRAALNKVLHPELDAYGHRIVPGEIHHTLGRRANAYDISFSPRTANRLEGNARRTFDSSWKNISKLPTGTAKERKIRFGLQKKALTNYTTKMEGTEGIAYGIKPGGKIRGGALDFKPWVTRLLKDVNDLTNSQKTKVAVALNCLKVAEGGRIGYALGSATINCVNTKLTNEPVQSSMRLRAAEGVGKIRGVATNFLKLAGKFGAKAAPLAGLAVAGAVAEPLIKKFFIDEPDTYLTNENQMKGMLLSIIEGETPKVDEEILKWQYPGLGAATLAGAVPGAGEVYKARRALRPPNFIGPMEKGVGPARAALGIKGVLGKALGATFSPLAGAATLPLTVAAQRKGGTEWGDIATDPMNWMTPAFASEGARLATKGMNPTGIMAQAIRLGMSPRTLSLVSRRLGWPGLAVSAGLWGYDKWKNRSINDED